jgi:hypothetical protein
VKRFVRIVAISLGSLLIFAVAVVFVSTLALEYRFDRQNRQLAQSISLGAPHMELELALLGAGQVFGWREGRACRPRSRFQARVRAETAPT